MYIFGGRIQDGTDLGDLAAFRISTRRWYMFQNMGPSPSPRSGHSMTTFGKHVVVLGGEPSSAPRDSEELSIAYLLDTSKIRYPPADQRMAVRKMSGERPAQSLNRKEATLLFKRERRTPQDEARNLWLLLPMVSWVQMAQEYPGRTAVAPLLDQCMDQ